VRRCLAEAYEREELRGKDIAKARMIVERRLTQWKKTAPSGSGGFGELHREKLSRYACRPAHRPVLRQSDP